MRPGLHFDLTRPRRRPSVRHIAHCIVVSIDLENTQIERRSCPSASVAAKIPLDRLQLWNLF
jgi:hypothetical protein